MESIIVEINVEVELIGYVTVKEASDKWKVSPRTVQMFCSRGRIEGAIKVGNMWLIPESSELPKDGRIKSGKYINWREDKNKTKEDL